MTADIIVGIAIGLAGAAVIFAVGFFAGRLYERVAIVKLMPPLASQMAMQRYQAEQLGLGSGL